MFLVLKYQKTFSLQSCAIAFVTSFYLSCNSSCLWWQILPLVHDLNCKDNCRVMLKDESLRQAKIQCERQLVKTQNFRLDRSGRAAYCRIEQLSYITRPDPPLVRGTSIHNIALPRQLLGEIRVWFAGLLIVLPIATSPRVATYMSIR